jgi:hypothetical protein
MLQFEGRPTHTHSADRRYRSSHSSRTAVHRSAVLREQIVILHRCLLAIVRDDEVCRRLMTTPGVGFVPLPEVKRTDSPGGTGT